MLNLKNDIKTVKVTSDPNSYSTFVYGEVKIGKSTFIKDLFGERALFLMTENRERGLVGADVAKINSWTDFTLALDQLGRFKELREKYDVIVIDTVDELKRYVENYAKAYHNENALGENAGYGRDYKYATDEWENNLPKIHDLGFTPVFVGHDKKVTQRIPATKVEKSDIEGDVKEVRDGKDLYYEIEQSQPDLPTKYMNPLNKSVDQILYLSRMYDEENNEQRVIHLRNTSQWVAGSTFENMKPLLPLDAKAYKAALKEAVNSYSKDNQTDEDYNKIKEKTPFDELKKKAIDLGTQLVKDGKKQEVAGLSKEIFGENQQLKTATEKQYEQVELFLARAKKVSEDAK